MKTQMTRREKALNKKNRHLKRNACEIVLTVRRSELGELNRRIAYKVDRNAVERDASEALAGAHVVH